MAKTVLMLCGAIFGAGWVSIQGWLIFEAIRSTSSGNQGQLNALDLPYDVSGFAGGDVPELRVKSMAAAPADRAAA